MYRGANTLVVEAKDKIINTVNDCIKTGVPAAMVVIMLESVTSDLNANVKLVLQKEKEEYDEQIRAESEQVEYQPEETVEQPEEVTEQTNNVEE